MDGSDSARGDAASGALAASAVAERLRAGQDALHLFRMAHNTTEIGTGQTMGDAEATLALIRDPMRKRDKARGTLPERFWTQIAAQVESAGKTDPRPVVIALATDGDNDDLRPKSERRIAACLEALARNPRVRGIVVCGLRPDNMAEMRARFARFGPRFHPFTSGENDPNAVASVVVGCAESAP